MADRPTPPAPVVAALVRAFPQVEPANRNDRYDERLNGHPVGAPWREVRSLPVLDSDIGVELRRAALEVVRCERLCIPIEALTAAEIHAMTTSRITDGEPYDLDDIDEDGIMLNGKQAPSPTA